MSKVLLLASAPSENNNSYFPYAILFLRSALEKEGHDVTLVDFQLGHDAYSLFKSSLLEKPDVLGVSLFCGPGVPLAQKASRLCKSISPETKIVWGGILPTISPEMVLQEKSVDYVLRFEAEESFPSLVKALENGVDLKEVPNLCYRNDDQFVIPPPPKEPIDLSDFPPVDFGDLKNPKYISQGLHIGKRVVSILTSRGCPYNCTFCYNLHYNQRRWRPFPVEWTLETVDKLVKTFQIDGLLAFDDNFFVDVNRARAILEGVKARGHQINWWVELRVDQILAMNIDELRELRSLGVFMAYVGMESGSNRILKLFNKRVTSDDIREANRKLAKTGIASCYTFIVGAPTETASETLETVDLSMELLSDNPLASLWQFNQFTPYPGTPLYNLAVKKGFKPYETLEDWDVGWTHRDENMSTTTLTESKMATLRYAALFQKPDEYLTNRTLPYKLAYKTFRSLFGKRLRRHIFTPFIDTWAIGAIYQGAAMLNRFRLERLGNEL